MENYLVRLAWKSADSGYQSEEMVIPASNAYAAMDIMFRNFKTELETAERIEDAISRPMKVHAA